MAKLRKIFTNTRIWIYIVFFVLTLLAININPWNSGVTIRTVGQNSSAYGAGMLSPGSGESPMARARIVEVNRILVKNVEEFEKEIDKLPVNSTLVIKTEKSKIGLFSEKKTYSMNFISKEKLGLKIYEAPKSNIIFGIDLQGGTRVVLEPETQVSKEDMDILLGSMGERLNLFGLSDTSIRVANDLSGKQFIVVEIAGANEEEVKDLLAKQGKFEAKIKNQTVFIGGRDISYVCRTAQCSGIDPSYGCRDVSEGASCQFRFSITLTKEAAQKQADVTKTSEVVYDGYGESYLADSIELYLDDNLVDSLRIGADLKGNPVTDIAISGSGIGKSKQEAQQITLSNMKKLQTVLITGSLPVKLKIIKTDALSPSLGKEFLNNAVLIAILAEIAVVSIIVLRYRKIKIAIPIVTIISSEILLILGISALFKQNLDIAGIAGIIVAIGTGVDDQIVITDELLGHDKKDTEKKSFFTWSDRIKKAFFIVFACYFATVASMIPLLFAGAGLLKGFAIATIIGVTNGVFITRPAFAQLMEILLNDDED
jgi:preprotein translocase subunit SecD